MQFAIWQPNVIWFNPPYSKNVKTNIARDFLRLLDKHFPPSHKLYSIFNRHMMFLTLGVQLYDSFTVFLLNTGLKVWPFAKHSSTILRNCFPRLVFTCMSYGGLYHVMFLLHDRFFLPDSSLGLNYSLYA